MATQINVKWFASGILELRFEFNGKADLLVAQKRLKEKVTIKIA